MGFAAHRKAIMDPVLRDDAGEAWCEGLGAGEDTELERFRQAALCHAPARCPDDGLDVTAEGLDIQRYPGESHASLRGRAGASFPTHKLGGAPNAIVRSLQAYGIPDVRVLREESGHYWNGRWYSRFRVQLGPSLGILVFTYFIIGQGVIGTTPIGGPHLDGDQRRAVKSQILRWKAAHGYAVDIMIRIAGDIIGQDCIIGSSVIGGAQEQIWIGRLIGKNCVIGTTPIGGYDRS